MNKGFKFLGLAAVTVLLAASCDKDDNYTEQQEVNLVACEMEASSFLTNESVSGITRASAVKRKIQYIFTDKNNTPLNFDQKDGVPYQGVITEGQAFKVYLPAGQDVVVRFANDGTYADKEDFEFVYDKQENNLVVTDENSFFKKETISVPQTTFTKKFTLERISAKFVAIVGDMPTGTTMKVEVITPSNVFHWLKDSWNRGGSCNSYGNFTQYQKGETLEQWTTGTEYLVNSNGETINNFNVKISMFNHTGNVNGQTPLDQRTFNYQVGANTIKTVTFNYSGNMLVTDINDTPMTDVDGGTDAEF